MAPRLTLDEQTDDTDVRRRHEYAFWRDLLMRTAAAHPGVSKEMLAGAVEAAVSLFREGELERSGEPRVVCLCGSSRFYRAFRIAEYDEAQAGRIVLSLGFKPDLADGEHGESVGTTPESKKQLDDLHFARIRLAHEVLILNLSGYVGYSTARELAYAVKIGRTVRWLEEPPDGWQQSLREWDQHNHGQPWQSLLDAAERAVSQVEHAFGLNPPKVP